MTQQEACNLDHNEVVIYRGQKFYSVGKTFELSRGAPVSHLRLSLTAQPEGVMNLEGFFVSYRVVQRIK